MKIVSAGSAFSEKMRAQLMKASSIKLPETVSGFTGGGRWFGVGRGRAALDKEPK